MHSGFELSGSVNGGLSPSQREQANGICSKFAISEQMKKNLLPLAYSTSQVQELVKSIEETINLLEEEENSEEAKQIINSFEKIKK